MLGDENQLVPQCEGSVSVRSEGLVEGLRRKKLRLTSQLKDATDALDALENNPDTAKILELVLKAGRI